MSKVFIAEVFNNLFINIRLVGCVGSAVGFLALLQVGFVSGFVRLQMCYK